MTKRALGMMFQNEAEWLSLHLPFLVSDDYDLLLIDGGSVDNSHYIAEKYSSHVKTIEFKYDWAEGNNNLFQFGRSLGYDFMIHLDPDELMFQADMIKLFDQLESGVASAFILPRYNFETDREHWCPHLYPDGQIRAVNTNRVRVEGAVHPHVSVGGVVGSSPDTHIYHYEGLRDNKLRAFKGLNYRRVAQGLPWLKEMPAEMNDVEYFPRPNVLFSKPQPTVFSNVKAPY